MVQLPHIAFEITGQCNLNCVYCYNIWKMPGAQPASFNSYPKAVVTLKELFQQADVQSIAFTGGEPLLAKRFPEVILFCRMAGKSVTLITNGTHGAKSDYKQLLQMGVGLFEIPVHSAQAEIHDRMVRKKDSWKKAVASIQTILQLGGYVVPVIVLTRHNANQIDETLRFIHTLGCRRIMLNRYNIGGEGCLQALEISARADELQQAFAVANRLSAELGLRITSNVCSPNCLISPKNYPNIGFGHCSFNVLQRPVTLDMNGNIRLCNHSPVVAGNIFEQSLESILFSEYTDSWKKTVPDFCSACEEWTQCKGGCRAASEQCFGTLSREDPILSAILFKSQT